MKPIITLTFLLLALTVKAQKSYRIEGRLQGIDDGTKISLYQDDGNVLSPISTDTIEAGVFRFKGTIDQPTKLLLVGNSPGFPSQWLEVWVAPDIKVKIIGSNKLLKTWEVESPMQEQKELNRYIRASRTQLDELQKLSIERNELLSGGVPTEANAKKRFRHVVDSIDRHQDSISNVVSHKEIEILQTQPVTPIWMDKLKGIAMTAKFSNNSTVRGPAINLFNKLNSKQKTTEEGYQIQAFLFPPKVVKDGEPMADTVFSNLAGEKKSLSDYKGKYLVLDFWSMGCGPCIAAMPELKEMSEKYKDKLTVVSLSVDVKKSNWQKASEQHKVSWENLNDGKGMAGIAARYGVNGIPHYVMISPEGTVLGSWVGYGEGQLEEKIKKYIK